MNGIQNRMSQHCHAQHLLYTTFIQTTSSRASKHPPAIAICSLPHMLRAQISQPQREKKAGWTSLRCMRGHSYSVQDQRWGVWLLRTVCAWKVEAESVVTERNHYCTYPRSLLNTKGRCPHFQDHAAAYVMEELGEIILCQQFLNVAIDSLDQLEWREAPFVLVIFIIQWEDYKQYRRSHTHLFHTGRRNISCLFFFCFFWSFLLRFEFRNGQLPGPLLDKAG